LLVLAALAVAYPLSAVLLAWLPLGLPAPLRALAALPPFILTGAFSALAFAAAPGESGSLCAVDLVGAAGGTAVSLGLLGVVGAFNVASALGVVVALAGVAFAVSPLSPAAGSDAHRPASPLSPAAGSDAHRPASPLSPAGERGEAGALSAAEPAAGDGAAVSAPPQSQSVAHTPVRPAHVDGATSGPGAHACALRTAAPLAALLLNAALLALNLSQGRLDLTAAGLAAAPRDKTMAQVLADPAQEARIVHTAWDPFARVDVVETNDPAAKLVFADGGAGSYMLRFDGDLTPLAPLRDTIEFLPFSAGPNERTLILGAGAGKDVLLALLGGSQAVTAVEVNPATVAATRRFAAYNGSILDRPEVRLEVGDARTFVERDRSAYDLIYLNLVYTQAAEPAGQALVEGYVFTREAFRACLARLAPGGRMAIVAHSALEGSRAALTALAAIEAGGKLLPPATRHLALLMLPAGDPTLRQTVAIVGREPLDAAAVTALQQGAGRLGLTPLFLPGVFEATLQPLLEGMSLSEFVAGDPTYDLRPTGDDRPFFFKLDHGLPGPLAQALGGAAALAALLGLAALRPARRQGWAAGLGCVALMGGGYMLLEVALMHRFHLLLGRPALATAAVLGGLLAGGGVGSLVSQRWPEATLGRRGAMALLAGAALGLAGWLALPPLVAALLPAGLAWRALAAAGLATLMGLPLGIPLPSALRRAGGRSGAATPWLWSVNGAFSALGSSLAVALSVTWGFSGAVAAGVAAYLAAAVLWRRMLSTD